MQYQLWQYTLLGCQASAHVYFFLQTWLSKVNQLRRMNQAQVKILQISLSQTILSNHSLQLHIK